MPAHSSSLVASARNVDLDIASCAAVGSLAPGPSSTLSHHLHHRWLSLPTPSLGHPFISCQSSALVPVLVGLSRRLLPRWILCHTAPWSSESQIAHISLFERNSHLYRQDTGSLAQQTARGFEQLPLPVIPTLLTALSFRSSSSMASQSRPLSGRTSRQSSLPAVSGSSSMVEPLARSTLWLDPLLRSLRPRLF